MSEPAVPANHHHSRLTLACCALLHAFTHAYGTMLVPLYLLMVHDLKLPGVQSASLVVTIYGLVYSLSSFAAGILADRFDRRVMLGVGLLGNALAITLMGVTRRYEVILALGVVAGLFGTLFHPSAAALVPAHFPRNPGMAIGILGMGAGLGFFAGPQYAGWRAEAQRAAWRWGEMGDWQRPLVELGLLGVAFTLLFFVVAREVARPPRAERLAAHPPLGRRLRSKVAAVAATLGWRDFTGISSLSLVSIYLLRAHDYTAKQAGFIVGAMMLLGIAANPVAVYLTPGRRRLPSLAGVLIAGGVIFASVPWVPVALILPVLCLFQAVQLGSYAISDAGILERIPAESRGRVVGRFLTIAGTIAAAGPWAMGALTDALGERASDPVAYRAIFAAVGGMMMLSSLAAPLIARLGEQDETAIEPLAEVAPATLEPLG
jgi:MFS family permease